MKGIPFRSTPKNFVERAEVEVKEYFDGPEYIALEAKVRRIMKPFKPFKDKWITTSEVCRLLPEYSRELIEDALRTTFNVYDQFSIKKRWRRSQRIDAPTTNQNAWVFRKSRQEGSFVEAYNYEI